ncbi:unnamed protein product [Arabis nemorensis]|uniref:SHSP domain-containing protein n=1 Tax=Arabis nemorensis TaxID=586526 RepID=A0A565CUT2_9BRAS|nr:unnamed protein product [Arabis nemorensis]
MKSSFSSTLRPLCLYSRILFCNKEELFCDSLADPKLTGPVLQPHSNVLEGSNVAYESKQLENGKLYVRVDMSGVSKDNLIVSVTNGRVNVTGLATTLLVAFTLVMLICSPFLHAFQAVRSKPLPKMV